MQIDIRYIGNSGYSASLQKHFLLFDYFFGRFPGSEINAFKYPTVFASHSHSDHFNKKIFTLADKNPSVRFYLSDDIKAMHSNAVHMKPGDIRKEKDIEVFAFGSTDIGASFAIMCEGITIFHAGDLNLWSWKKESTEAEIKEAYDMFETEINKIALQFEDFDIAFFPVDPRMQKDYDEGAQIFLERFNVTHFFPMHFGTKTKAAKDFKNKYSGDTIIHAPQEAGEEFIINI